MNRRPSEPIEQRLQRVARAFPYPATPSIAAAVRDPRRRARGFVIPRRSLLVAAAVVVALAALLLAVPDVRAAVRSWLIGVIEIVPNPPRSSPPAPSPATATPAPEPSAALTTPTAEAGALRGLVGPTSLADARRRFPQPIRLPSYPAGLGEPDHVFLQNLDGSALILVWLDPSDASRVRLSLTMLTSPAFGSKTDVPPENARETMVNGSRAVWIDAPHLLEIYNNQGQRDIALRRLVEGNVLIWAQDGITFRLESDLALDDAIKAAESLEG